MRPKIDLLTAKNRAEPIIAEVGYEVLRHLGKLCGDLARFHKKKSKDRPNHAETETSQVRQDGDAALAKLAKRFDGAELSKEHGTVFSIGQMPDAEITLGWHQL